nr:hypothetical protein [Bacteroidota bacterium]
MKKVSEYIESGILELYVLGQASAEERKEIEILASTSSEIRNEIDAISEALENYVHLNAITPDPTIKPFLMAMLDYMGRMENGEQASTPPDISGQSKIIDYKEWLERPDMTLPADFKDIHAKIIGYNPKAITAIVWISKMAPQEVHDDEYEKFLIVEGTCDIVINGLTHQLIPGDSLSIPLH